MNVVDQAFYTTVRIETTTALGKKYGTGFFLNFCTTPTRNLPALITNKHVIDGATEGIIYISTRLGDANKPDLGGHVPVRISDFQNNWLLHGDPDVDLAAFPIAQLLDLLRSNGHQPFYRAIDTSFIADQAFMDTLLSIEQITMVGYPIGLWDSRNNLPIVRQGVTATPPGVDFQGRPQFLIDCACYPGSSGSPVFLINGGGYFDKVRGAVVLESRVKLLGVLFAGPMFTAAGQIQFVEVPTATTPIVQSQIPMNLGICVKAEQLLWFEEHWSKEAAAAGIMAPV